MPPKDKYTDPELREQVKEEVKESDKGGAPGQWSARKAQFMAQEYKRRGGGYNTDKSEKDGSQKNLSKWTEEEWQTKEGSGNAKQEDGTEKRYLPKKAWEQMTEEEKEETERKKLEGSKEGKQFVENTEKAKQSRKNANEEEGEEHEGESGKKRNGMKDKDEEEDEDGKENNHVEENGDEDQDDVDGEEDEAYEDDDGGDAEDDEAGNDEDEEEKTNNKRSTAGQKRKTRSDDKDTANKKQKSNSGKSGNAPPGKVGSKHMDDKEPAPRGSADRLPKKNQQITWKAMPGYVDGTVEEILTKEKQVNGKKVKASESDPRLVVKSKSSGKICVHKPDTCFYD